MSRRFFLGLLLCLGATCTGPIFADDLTRSQPGGWDAAVWDHLLASSPLNARLLRAGDMILTWDYVRQVRDWLKGGKVQPESAFDGSVTFWPGGVVYYAFASDITTLHRKAFTDAAADWSTFANITFVQRTTQSDYLFVQNGSGNSSGVGKLGGPQDFSSMPGRVAFSAMKWARARFGAGT